MLTYQNVSIDDLVACDLISTADITALSGREQDLKLVAGVKSAIQMELAGAEAEQLPARALKEFIDTYLPVDPGQGYEELISEAYVTAHRNFTTQSERTLGAEQPSYLETLQQCIALNIEGKIDERLSVLKQNPDDRVSKVRALHSLLEDPEVHLSETSHIAVSEETSSDNPLESTNITEPTKDEIVPEGTPEQSEIEVEEELEVETTGPDTRALATLDDIPPDWRAKINLPTAVLSKTINEYGLTVANVEDLAVAADKGIAAVTILAAVNKGEKFDDVIEVIDAVYAVSAEHDKFSPAEKTQSRNLKDLQAARGGRKVTEEGKVILVRDPGIDIEEDRTLVDAELSLRFVDTFGLQPEDLFTELSKVAEIYADPDLVHYEGDQYSEAAARFREGGSSIIEQVIKDSETSGIRNLDRLLDEIRGETRTRDEDEDIIKTGELSGGRQL